MHSSGMEVCLRSSLTNIAFSLKQTDQPPFSPIRSGPKAASKPSRQKQFPSSPSQAAALENDNEEAIVALENKLADLEERLANVEVIERFEDRLAARVADSAPGQETSGAETTYGSPGIEHER
jgi:hypothetical protein